MSEIVSIKIRKDISDLLFVYCKLNDVKRLDFVNETFEEKLKDFKAKFESLNDIKEK